MSLTTKLFNFCLHHSITLVPTIEWYVERPSRSGFSLDSHLDRMVAESSNFQILKQIFSEGSFQVDLSHSTNSPNSYLPAQILSSWNQRPLPSLGCLGFHLPFPLNSLSSRSSSRLTNYKGKGVLIAPWYAGLSWFPFLLERIAGSSASSFIPIPGHNRGQGIPLKAKNFPTSRFITIRRALRSKGFSQNIISIILLWLKDSSSLFQGIWEKFTIYLSQ